MVSVDAEHGCYGSGDSDPRVSHLGSYISLVSIIWSVIWGKLPTCLRACVSESGALPEGADEGIAERRGMAARVRERISSMGRELESLGRSLKAWEA